MALAMAVMFLVVSDMVGGAVGQDDVGSRVDETLVQRPHAIRVLEVPHFRRVTGGEAHRKQVGAGGTVGEQGPAGREQVGEH